MLRARHYTMLYEVKVVSTTTELELIMIGLQEELERRKNQSHATPKGNSVFFAPNNNEEKNGGLPNLFSPYKSHINNGGGCL